MEGKSEAEGIKGIADMEDRTILFWGRMGELFISEMIFSELVSKFKLGRFNLGQ